MFWKLYDLYHNSFCILGRLQLSSLVKPPVLNLIIYLGLFKFVLLLIKVIISYFNINYDGKP